MQHLILLHYKLAKNAHKFKNFSHLSIFCTQTPHFLFVCTPKCSPKSQISNDIQHFSIAPSESSQKIPKTLPVFWLHNRGYNSDDQRPQLRVKMTSVRLQDVHQAVELLRSDISELDFAHGGERRHYQLFIFLNKQNKLRFQKSITVLEKFFRALLPGILKVNFCKF